MFLRGIKNVQKSKVVIGIFSPVIMLFIIGTITIYILIYYIYLVLEVII